MQEIIEDSWKSETLDKCIEYCRHLESESKGSGVVAWEEICVKGKPPYFDQVKAVIKNPNIKYEFV